MLRPLPAILGLLAGGALLSGAGGCAEQEQRPEEPRPIASRGAPPFQPPSYSDGRRIDTIAAARVSGAKVPVFLVGSRGDSVAAPIRFDVVEAYAYDSLRGAWTRVLSDSVQAGYSVETRDLTGDGHEEIIVRLNYGGNEPVATFGMNVYSAHGGALRRVFRSTWMDPHVTTVPGIEGSVIAVRHALWPLFAPRSDAAIYIDDLFGFRDGRFRSIVDEAGAYFRSEADSALARYAPLRATIERRHAAERKRAAALRDSLVRAGVEGADSLAASRDSITYEEELGLYQSSALIVHYRMRSGDARGARAFWNRERGFLRSVLREEQFDELAAFTEQLLSPG